MKRATALRLWILLAIVLGVTASLAVPQVRHYLTGVVSSLLDQVKGLGMWGPVILAAVYIVGSIVAFPGLPLSMGAGFLFGPWVGTVTASIGSTLGAAAAFLVGRTLARGIVEEKVSKDTRFRAIDRAVAVQGFKIVFLIRLAPIFPYNLLNYAFGLTKVRFRDYLLASWIGMFPATAFNVYIGSLLSSLSDVDSLPTEASRPRQVFFYVGIIVTLLVVIYVTRLAKAALARAVPEVEDNELQTQEHG